MKHRFPVREFALLCLPVGIVGLGWVVSQLRDPPKDPNAKINLVVKQKSARVLAFSSYPQVQFAWEAVATGGPQDGYLIGFHERIVARLPQSELIIYENPPQASTPASSNDVVSTGGGGYTPGKMSSSQSELQFDPNLVVPGAKLEWRGDFVASPHVLGGGGLAVTPKELARWVTFRGAVRVRKSFPLRFDTQKNALKVRTTADTNVSNASTVSVLVSARNLPRRTCRRLVAFDGKTIRPLWNETDEAQSFYLRGQQSMVIKGMSEEGLHFQLRGIPQAWGEVVFLYDTVYLGVPVPDTPIQDEPSNLATLAKLEAAGGIRQRRRLVVRRDWRRKGREDALTPGETAKVKASKAEPTLRTSDLP